MGNRLAVRRLQQPCRQVRRVPKIKVVAVLPPQPVGKKTPGEAVFKTLQRMSSCYGVVGLALMPTPSYMPRCQSLPFISSGLVAVALPYCM